MTTKPTPKEVIAAIQQHYPAIFSLKNTHYFLGENTKEIKLAQGNLSAADMEELLKNPYSLQSQILVFNIMQTVIAQQVMDIKKRIAQQEAQLEKQSADHPKRERPHQQLIDQGEIEYSKQLLKRIENNFDTATKEENLFKELSVKLDNINTLLKPLEAAYRKEFNDVLETDYKDYFTEEEKKTYKMTPEKQEKLHKSFHETKQNFEKLVEMAKKNPAMADKPFSDFKEGNVPQFEIKAFRDIAGINPERHDNLQPSQTQKFSKAPKLFEIVLTQENNNYHLYQQKRSIEEQIQQNQSRYYMPVQNTVKDIETFNALNQKHIFVDLVEEKEPDNLIDVLNNLYNLSFSPARFEYMMGHKLREISSHQQATLEKKLDEFIIKNPHSAAISLKSILEEIVAVPKLNRY